jgi:hypothetical protein
MIQSARLEPEGSLVELRRGAHVITAQIVWRDGSRAGVQAQDRVPIEDIILISGSQPIRLIASNGLLVERRRHRRLAADSRSASQFMQFVALVAVGILLAVVASFLVNEALSNSLGRVSEALGSSSASTGPNGAAP